MLRTNLATRPFYNVRAAQMALGCAGVILLVATLFNVAQVVQLGMSQQSLGARAVEAEEESAQLRIDAAQILAEINPQELEVVANAAREANAIIDQRAFSWTELFGRFETTLPPEVRITAVQPRLDSSGGFVVAIRVEARQAEDLDAFIESLETSAGFRDALAVQAQTGLGGLIEAIVEGTYAPPLDDMSVPPPDDMSVPPPDGLGVPPPDGLGVLSPGDLGVPPPDDLGVPLPGDLGVPPPNGTGVPPPDATGTPPPDATGTPPPDATGTPPPDAAGVESLEPPPAAPQGDG